MPNQAQDDDFSGDGLALFAALTQLGVRVTDAMADAVNNPAVLGNLAVQILIDLHMHGSRQPSQLAARLGVSRPQITQLLNQLEDEHLIHRRAGVAPDRRVTTVTLAPAGRQVIQAADHVLQRGFDDVASVTQTIQTFLQRTRSPSDTPVRQTAHPSVVGRTPGDHPG
jgi:DNA-binding MarR family transcriptional regulator